jgi:predicted kinase
MTQHHRPIVVALIGLPGAGKSVVAAHLAARLGLRRVCRDAIRAAMFPRCAWTPTEKRAAFRAVLLATEVNLALGESTVIDGMTFSRTRDRDKVQALAERYALRYLPVWLDVAAATARTRVAADLAAGRHAAGDRTPTLIDRVQERFEAPSHEYRVDAESEPGEVCAEVERRVRLARGEPV